jgi:hypothetical protein
VTGGRARFELAADNLGDLLRAFATAHPQAGYRLYSPGGQLLRYHLFIVDGEQVLRATPPGEVPLTPESTVEIVPPLSGG